MAANYWVSSQRLHWQMSREKLAETRAALDAQDQKTVQAYPLPSYRRMSIYFNQRTTDPCPHTYARCGLLIRVRRDR